MQKIKHILLGFKGHLSIFTTHGPFSQLLVFSTPLRFFWFPYQQGYPHSRHETTDFWSHYPEILQTGLPLTWVAYYLSLTTGAQCCCQSIYAGLRHINVRALRISSFFKWEESKTAFSLSFGMESDFMGATIAFTKTKGNLCFE